MNSNVPPSPPPPQAGAGDDEVTPLLCAAAFARPDRVAAGAKWSSGQLANAAEKLGDVLRRRYRLFAALRPKPERLDTPSESERTRDPEVVLGDAYARWVLSRIAASNRPVPVIGFDQDEVVAACRHGMRLGRQRRLLVASVLTACLAGPISGTVPALVAAVSLPVLLWAVFLSDRIRAQYALHTAVQRHGRQRTTARFAQLLDRGVSALPYTREKEGKYGIEKEHRFIGAGLEVWHPTTLSVDVTKGRRTSASDGTDGGDPADTLASFLRHMNGPTELEPKGFSRTELYEHVSRDLGRSEASEDNPDDHRPVDVIGIWGTPDHRWDKIGDEMWEHLPPVTEGLPPGDTAPDSRLARPYLWARITGWSGALTVSALVRFDRRDEYLRVVIVSQVMAPLVDRVTGLHSPHPARVTWLAGAAVQAVGDIVELVGHPVRHRPAAVPELDPGDGPVSLREAYSKRRVPDMHMDGDSRFQADVLHRRVLDSVERFLVAHDIDVARYREDSSKAMVNFGVIGENINGNVQNNPMGVGNIQQGEAA
ncbi:hypothetical protein ACFOVU_04760 [Nocardiopsis sediminis]|uniref:Uncharacterized protein n=1 Tax=Nocardiopsis sediminis TaxID=1778267 RepID=A0ABV8FGF2_9ACTN